MMMSDKYYITVVLEYPSIDSAPRIGPRTKDFMHDRVQSLQFSDALKEIESLEAEVKSLTPKWTKITDDPATWPEDCQDVLINDGFTTDLEPFEHRYAKVCRGEYWRPLMPFDTPENNHDTR